MAFNYKAYIAFGLVYIPVKLHAAVKENAVGFNMLDKKTQSRIKYKKTCEECDGKEVAPSDIVKGYEYEEDKYVIFDNQEIEKIKTQKDKNITIESFIDASEVDAVFYADNYYVEPTGAEKAYHLLAEAMRSEGKAGVAKSVLGNKESIILLRAKEGALMLTTLHFYEEIQPMPFNAEQVRSSDKELEMAVSLIRGMSERFRPEDYKDEYSARLKKAIEDKVAGREIEQEKAAPRPKVTDLMSALKESVRLMKDSPAAKTSGKTVIKDAKKKLSKSLEQGKKSG